MPPDKRQERVTEYVRKDGTRVRSHTRNAQWARAKSTWISAGFSTLTAVGILLEAGVTLISTLCVLLVAVLGTIAVMAGRYAEHNRKTMAKQQARRTTRTTRTTRTASSRGRTSSGRSRTSGRPRTSSGRRRR